MPDDVAGCFEEEMIIFKKRNRWYNISADTKSGKEERLWILLYMKKSANGWMSMKRL